MGYLPTSLSLVSHKFLNFVYIHDSNSYSKLHNHTGKEKRNVIIQEVAYNSKCKNKCWCLCKHQSRVVLWSIPECKCASHICLCQAAYGTCVRVSSPPENHRGPLRRRSIPLAGKIVGKMETRRKSKRKLKYR